MKISFIGHGNMAKAIIAGLLKSQLVKEEDVFTSDSFEENQEAVDFGDYIFLTIKPQLYQEVLAKLSYPTDKLFITVAPGIKTSSIAAKVIRTMPNTPALIGAGVTAICRNQLVSDEEYAQVKTLLSTFSEVYEFDEEQLDEIVALSGSSPAYFYLLLAAMTTYSSEVGIAEDVALKMAAQTMIGAAKMVLETNTSPTDLCARVCSAKGTTIEAVKVLEAGNFSGLIGKAMAACTTRAKELAIELSGN